MNLADLLRSMNADAVKAEAKRQRQLDANARWKAKNPQKVKAQSARRMKRLKDREAA